MKKFILTTCLLLLACVAPANAQTENGQVQTGQVQTAAQVQNGQAQAALGQTVKAPAKFGCLRYDSLLHALPEYGAMQIQLQKLREKYEAEVSYNEQGFKRMFAEYLQGQKDFPQNILLKRQRDLQAEMEKGIAFREEADSLLQAAEADMEQPVRDLLNAAIEAVGLERGYDYIIDLDNSPLPFINPALTEDVTPLVLQKIGILRNK
ncbi:MAG: OmpH family outer membrane protein [Bacteroidales bacterium]|nr:OmpH family outer membrane protein [Bacteroidales bacterium]